MPRCRNTVQKEQVYAAVTALANHPTADEVYAHVRLTYPSISRATVYRILNQMAENGAVSRVRVSNYATHYDHCTAPHNHARCVKCGRVFDVHIKNEIEIDYSAIEAGGADIIGHSLVFTAVCGDCLREDEP